MVLDSTRVTNLHVPERSSDGVASLVSRGLSTVAPGLSSAGGCWTVEGGVTSPGVDDDACGATGAGADCRATGGGEDCGTSAGGAGCGTAAGGADCGTTGAG